MEVFEPVVEHEAPDLVLVVGYVNSTVACGLVVAKLHLPVTHVEACLHNFDRRMPEEFSRVLADQVSEFLLVTEESGVENIRSEAVEEDRIRLVGNVKIDSLLAFRVKAAAWSIRAYLGPKRELCALMPMHRGSSVDDGDPVRRIVEMIERLTDELPVRLPHAPLHAEEPRGPRRLGSRGHQRRPAGVRTRELAGLPPVNGAPGRSGDRRRRGPGGDHLPAGALSYRAGEHRAAGHRRNGDEGRGAARLRVDLESLGPDPGRRPPLRTSFSLWHGRAARRIMEVLEMELAL